MKAIVAALLVFVATSLAIGLNTEGGVPARRTAEFLDSIGVCSSFPDRGQPLEKTVEMIRYCGFRWIRGGIEGLTNDGPTTLDTYRELHRRTRVRFSWGLGSGGSDLSKLIATAREMAKAGTLLALEGNNEPNNWGVTYEGEAGGGRAPSWMAVAKLQRDMYRAVKNDAVLRSYPVWSISENGAEVDNVGLQFLVIPKGAGTLMPEGTRYADYANVHNYIYHPNSPFPEDNKTWNAADPTSACRVDGLYGNYGTTWLRKYRGYSEEELMALARVTTETGCTTDDKVTEELQALNLMSLYLDQYKRGYSYTSVYILRDRTDEAGNQSFGFFRRDYTPRRSALYLRNLTTILADRGAVKRPARLAYRIPNQPETVHDLLLQRSDGAFQLVVWDERLHGKDNVAVELGREWSRVRLYDPTVGSTPTRDLRRVRSVQLTLSDHPVILEIPSKDQK